MKYRLTAAFIASLLAANGSSQLPQSPLFRSGVEHVVLDVIATDADDQPVRDLEIQEFQIHERGKPQTIRTFERINLGDRGIGTEMSIDGLDPFIAHNAAPALSSRAFVFIIDDGLVNTSDLVLLKELAHRLLDGLSPPDLAALVYVNRSDLGYGFTTNHSLLRTAVERASDALGGPSARGATFSVLRNAITVLGHAGNARRAIVYISSGTAVPLAPQTRSPSGGRTSGSTLAQASDAASRLRETLSLARRTGVPIYTVDPHGLASPESVSNIGRISNPVVRKAITERIRLSHEFLHDIAAATGGRAFVNQSDLSRTADALMAENGSYYVLGYQPSPYVADGKFHPVDVRVTRSGVRVRARSGYVASAGDPASLRTTAQWLENGRPGGDLSLRVFAVPVEERNKQTFVNLTLEILYPDATQITGADNITVSWVAIDEDARVRASGGRTLSVSASQLPRQPGRVILHELLDLPAKKTEIRVAVSSAASGRGGVVHLPLDAQRIFDDEVALGPLALHRVGDGSAAIFGRFEKLPFGPTTERSFGADERIRVFSRAFHRLPQGTTGELLLLQDTQVISRFPVRIEESAVANMTSDCFSEFVTDGVGPGIYQLTLELTLPAGRRISEATTIQVRD